MALAYEMLGGGVSAGMAQAIQGQAASVVAAGSTQANSTTLTASVNLVTAADGTKGVVLPAGAVVGDEVWVFNSSASTLKVWPQVGAAIAVPGTGLGSANASFAHLTFKTVLYKLHSSTQWFPMVTV